VLLLLDYWPLNRFQPQASDSRLKTLLLLVLEKVPFLAAAFSTSLLTLRAANRAGWLPYAAQCPILDAWPMRSFRMPGTACRYSGRRFGCVLSLSASFAAWSVTGAALLLLGITAASFCMARRRPYVVVGWLWYLVTLLPVIGLIQLAGYSHADRYTYVPLIGLFVSLVWGAGEFAGRWPQPAPGCTAAAVAAAMVLCLALTRPAARALEEQRNLVPTCTRSDRKQLPRARQPRHRACQERPD